MFPTCSDAELDRLAAAVVSSATATPSKKDKHDMILTIKKLKRYLTTDARKLIGWAYNALQQQTPSKDVSNNSVLAARIVMDTLFDLAKDSAETSSWLVCYVSEKLHVCALQHIHQYLIIQFAKVGNPHISAATTMDAAQSQLTTFASTFFSHMLHSHAESVQQSLSNAFDAYITWASGTDAKFSGSDMDVDQIDTRAYTLSYMLGLPKISADLTNACWGAIARKLLNDDVLGNIFVFEREENKSLVRTTEGDVNTVSKMFPAWLYGVEFDRSGVVMKHALDIAIILDTMAHNPRLGLEHLMPSSGQTSVIDSLRPTFEQLNLEPASIDIVDWVVSILNSESGQRQKEGLKIPLFLLQLIILKNNEPSAAIDTLVQLVTSIVRTPDDNSVSNGYARYIILSLVEAASEKWPDIFQSTLGSIFSKAIATHIANSAGAVNVQKILANITLLFEDCYQDEEKSSVRPGFSAFQLYIMQHWRQVLLLFVNHPSMECRALGYRMLTVSKLWEYDKVAEASDYIDPNVLAKLFTDAWFRHMKSRYLYFEKETEASVLDEFEDLIIHCCQNMKLAKAIHTSFLDAILGGALEIFPPVDLKALQEEKKNLLEKMDATNFHSNSDTPNVVSSLSVVQGPTPSNQSRPPQFLVTPKFLQNELEIQDKTYIDNVERTARLFYNFKDVISSEDQVRSIILHILSHMSSKWPSSTATWQAYDDALPRNIPSPRDIAIGNAFKDYPVLFLILDKCSSAVQHPVDDTLRSVLVYFIAFWHMSQVAQAPTALKFATQLEETIRLIMLLEQILPKSLMDIYHILPFMSAQDVGSVLYQVIWPFLRSDHSPLEIPGLEATTQVEHTSPNQEMETKCLGNMISLYKNRLTVLQSAPSWHHALEQEAIRIGIRS
ncbi:hypothetical protein LRAMOSA00309 [Lichtheimia ramosa]|uniref:Integrator complex subunit 5 C-terminal domain-containing protein n=1 Tax=Lichtheimia ramosa TaxID=688394 RepID=A0A077W651_9FUNG|nr:hypothetical protein LRAMOSA00309 [Lichtheimia ramosa]